MDPSNNQQAKGASDQAASKTGQSNVQAISSLQPPASKGESKGSRGKSKNKNSSSSNIQGNEKKQKGTNNASMRAGQQLEVAASLNSQASLQVTQVNNLTSGNESNKMAQQSLQSTVANSQVFSSSKPPVTKRGAESFTSQSKREQSASRPTTNRKLSKLSRDVNIEGVSRSNSNSLKPQVVDGMIDSQNMNSQQQQSSFKQSTSLNKLPKKNNQNDHEVTSQSNTLDAVRENGGGKTPGNKGTKRQKNLDKKSAKAEKGSISKEVKKGSSTNKIFELQPQLQRSNTAQGKDLTVQSTNEPPLQNENDVMHKSEIMSKEEAGGSGTPAQRGESINNRSELMLNNNSTADRERSQNPPRAESMAISNDRQNKQETEIGGDSLIVKRNIEKHSESFNLRRRSSSQSLKSKEILASTPQQQLELINNNFIKDNKSLSDAQDDGQENFGDDEGQGNTDNEADDSNLNIMEKFRQVMKEKLTEGSLFGGNPIGPPPEELIRKTATDQEPVKTGAPIAFVKFQRLMGVERIEKMNPDNDKREIMPDNNGSDIAQSCTICEYMLNARGANSLVYCRFGEKYLIDMERRQKSLLTAMNQPTSNLGTATYLINIKKLVEEHNIEGEKRDFKTMRTGQIGKGMQSSPNQYYKLQGPEDKTLIFESRFESGNLLSAIKVSETEYDLILQNDINTNGHTQWYFFRVGNTTKGMTVKFNMLNLMKPDSLYNYGMKILSFSQKVKEQDGIGWHRIGENINYHMNNYKRDNFRFQRYHYTFTFTHTFEHDDDQMFFSHCFPYTYSDLVEDLNRIEKDTTTQNYYHRATLTRTLAGNKCEYLTITSKDKDPKSAKALAKKGIFISARVHPGESNASWMMKGVIEYLVSQTPEARALRDHFVFKIVPILNPDGVINGNYRCSLAGQDLNRRYKAPSRVIHPVIFAVKKLIRQFSKERNLLLYVDLHGHSRRKNIFMYGNNIKERPHETRVFPYILSKLCDFFSFEQSRFSMNRLKDGTARIAMFKELNIPNIFTMEASFCGADRGEYKDRHFSTDYLMEAGQKLMESLLVYCKIEVNYNIKEIRGRKKEEQEQMEKQMAEQQSKRRQIHYQELNAQALERELHGNKKLIAMTMGDEGNSSGSDSEPSADNLDAEEIEKIVPQKPKKEEPPKKKPVPPPPPKKEIKPIKKPQSPPAQIKRPPVMKEISKSPMKRPMFNAFDRLSLRKKKPEMKDAWTQTTPKSKEQMEKERREHRQRKNAHYIMLQQQQQQLLMQKFQQQQQQQQIQMQNHNQRASYPMQDQSNALMEGRLNSNSSNFKTKPNMIGVSHQGQYKGQSKSIHNQQQPNVMLMHNQQHPMSQMDKDRKPHFQEMGHSPQPQIRIRTEHHPSAHPQIPIKQKNDLMKYEERLISDKTYPQSQIQTYQNMGPQNGSATQQLHHRGSNKHLPQIQSSSSQRNKKNSFIEKTPQQSQEPIIRQQAEVVSEYDMSRAKTLNQTQYNSLKNQNNPQQPINDSLLASTQIHHRHTSGQQNMTGSQPQILSQQVTRSAYNGTGRKLVATNGSHHQSMIYKIETPDNNGKKRQHLHPNANARQQLNVSMSPNKLNKIPITAQSTGGVNLHHQIINQVGGTTQVQPLLNNFQQNPGVGANQQSPPLFTNTAISRMQVSKKSDNNHNSIAALQYSGMTTQQPQQQHNSSALINLHGQQKGSGSNSKMSQKKPSSSTTQKVQWTNSTIQQQSMLSGKQLLYHHQQQQQHGHGPGSSTNAQIHQMNTVTAQYRQQISQSQSQNPHHGGSVSIQDNRKSDPPNVFSGSSLTNSGQKILVTVADGAHSTKQQSSLNKSLVQKQLSPFAYK